MALFPLTLPPGVYRNGTDYQSKGRYFFSKLVRWYESTLRPFGGWMKVTGATLASPARGLLTWRPVDFARQAAIGTVSTLHIWDDTVLVDITPAAFPAGNVDSFPGVGYGMGNYGAGPYGVTVGSTLIEATTWGLQTWGSNLLALASHDGKLYEYDNDGLPAALVAAAPTGGYDILVTDERIVVIIGSKLGGGTDRRSVVWCDVENHGNWVPDFDSFAGDKPITTDGLLVTARNGGSGWLLWSTTDIFEVTFIGLPGVYAFNRRGSHGGVVSKRSPVVVNGTAFWMGPDNFYVYRGGRPEVLPCDLHDYVFEDINPIQAAKFHTGQIAAFGEILFFYCSASSTQVDRCVSLNTLEGHWTIVDPDSTMARSAWADRGIFSAPLAVGEANPLLYTQETGWTADGTPLLSARKVQSGPAEIGNGDRLLEASMLVPDGKNAGKAQVRFAAKFTPEGSSFASGPFPTTPYTPIRLTARQVEVTIESTEDADFRIGVFRFEAREGGRR